MKSLRIIFMGTPEFATASLAKILTEEYQVVGVITAPDRPAGRGRKLQESDVKKFAVSKGLKVLQPVNLKDRDFLSELKALNADLQIVVAFRMLPRAVWSMPDLGTFNLHASLLPDYRGAAPINWAIINGETKTGATTFFIDEKIDTGEIILQEPLKISENETAGNLHDRLMHLGADLVLKTVREIEAGKVMPRKQKQPSPLKTAPKIHRDTCEIDWNASLETIHNKIRGLSPYPTAWTTLINGNESTQLKIYGSSVEKASHNEEIGSVLANDNHLKIAVENGFVELLEIQLPGKRKMRTKALLNGFHFEENARVR
ncbi:methionyl-tRNA formyltransferase [Pricia sp. S334]|uniref:Methionyl-tRNA formyltransferase n=1 Tax=Pricia mediterranea TaxID=3076079 RepID=A0ABU3L935_9FLAO|nr:methionyl-tRNA formyltransferase [Pricia sp. S334]MDT7830073.1 methionyl-tRNA formyltransferase [Pricia sp. S334]